MAASGRVARGTLFKTKQIRDTATHTSSQVHCPSGGQLILAARNTHNVALTLQYYGTINGTDWVKIGPAISIAATTGVDVQTLSDPWYRVKLEAVAGSSPASGQLDIEYSVSPVL